MRVAVVVRTLKIGGMEKVAVSLADAFAESGHESHLIYFKDRNNVFEPNSNVALHQFDLDKTLHYSGIGLLYEGFARLMNVIVRKSYFVYKGLATASIFKHRLSQLEKRVGDFDLVIVRGQGTFEMLWPIQDTRMVQVCENVVYSEPLKFSLHKLYTSLIYRQKNVACVSYVVEESFKKMQEDYGVDNPKVVTITNPIDSVETKVLSEAYQPEIKGPYIVNVGRIVPIKNIPLLVDAFHYARVELGLKHKLVIVGDGSDRKKVEQQVFALGLQDEVHFTGFISNPYPWMKEADLYVLSSISEGLGMVLLEAIASGTKVVSTDCDGVRDVMKGELLRNLAKQDVHDLAAKMMSALEDNSIDYKKYLSDFEPKVIVQKYIKNFKGDV